MPDLRVVGALVAAAALVTACTSTEPGEASGSPGGQTSTGTRTSGPVTSGTSPGADIPARPGDLPLDEVDPCALVTERQLDELGVNRTRATTNSSEIFEGAPECVLQVNDPPRHDYRVMLVLTEGIEAWLDGGRNVDIEQVQVGGYPAVSYWLADTEQAECLTAVDVADGQYMNVEFVPVGDGFQREQMCRMTERAAGMALQTLQTLK